MFQSFFLIYQKDLLFNFIKKLLKIKVLLEKFYNFIKA